MKNCPSTEELRRFFSENNDNINSDIIKDHISECDRCETSIDLVLAEFAQQATRTYAQSIARRRREIGIAVVASGLAAVAAFALYLRGRPWTPAQDPAPALALVQAYEQRTTELPVRLAYPGLDRHRTTSVPMSSEAHKTESMPYSLLARLQQDGDFYSIGIAELLNGHYDEAARDLVRTKKGSLAAESDLAAAELLVQLQRLSPGRLGEADARLRPVLARLDGVLQKNPHHPQALWNRALVLQTMGLTISAAATWKQIVEFHEPGWREEAERKLKGEALRVNTERATAWADLVGTGAQMIAGGPPLAQELIRKFPGTARAIFYDAVRSATSRERLRALRPLAVQLDRDLRSGSTALVSYLDRIERTDFRMREALAREYAELAQQVLLRRDVSWDREKQESFLRSAKQQGQTDLFFGAVIHLRRRNHYAELMPMAQMGTKSEETESGCDLWLRLLAENLMATADAFANHLDKAEKRLLDGRVKWCSPAIAPPLQLRCGQLQLKLVEIYQHQNRLMEAESIAHDGLRLARQSNEWHLETLFLSRLAEISLARSDESATRAYYGEALHRAPSEAVLQAAAHIAWAQLRLLALDANGVESELGSLVGNRHVANTSEAYLRVELARLRHRQADLEAAMAQLDALRNRTDLLPGEKIEAEQIRGRLLVDSQRAKGIELLRQAIRQADEQPAGDADAESARAYAYSSLVMDAGRNSDWAGALGILAEEIGAEPAERCVLGASIDNERQIVAVRDDQGRTFGLYLAARPGPQIDASAIVPTEFVQRLRSCRQVGVFARGALQGLAGLLPADLAWSFRLRRRQSTVPVALPSKRLVVLDVLLPEELGLAQLPPWPDSGELLSKQDPAVVSLYGADATPEQVLSAMSDATEIELRTHGVLSLAFPQDAGLVRSDPAYLVLSSISGSPPQSYALTATRIRKQSLRGAPLVFLVACHAARPASYQQLPWSLPMAFLEAGARAVLAGSDRIIAPEAAGFFAEIRQQVQSGKDPAEALRDERVKWKRLWPEDHKKAWAQAVLLFN